MTNRKVLYIGWKHLPLSDAKYPHLITAAPDMYEALRKIVVIGFSHFGQDDIDQARQALDKAEGKVDA